VAKVEIHVKGEQREYEFPADMPPEVWSDIVQTALNAVAAAEVTRRTIVHNPIAYVWKTMDRYSLAWRERAQWGEFADRLDIARTTRARLRSVLDLGAALQEMYLARGQSCWPQLRAVSGHDIGHPVAGPEACAACRAAADGEWPEFSRLTLLDAITMEHAYRAVRDARLVPETPRRRDWRAIRQDSLADDWDEDDDDN
jgi:hypothetical protein